MIVSKPYDCDGRSRGSVGRPDAGGWPTAGKPPAAPCFSLAALLDEIARHPELDLDTLGYHVGQSDATADDGYWHASINEARSFLEALLVGMLCTVCAEPADNYQITSRKGTPFRCYRRRLVEAGFLDVDENELLQYVYSVASAKGSHHGVTDEAWTRLARRMVWIAGQYLLKRYAVWKSDGMTEQRPGRLGRLGRLTRSARLGRAALSEWASRGRRWVLSGR